MPAGGSRPLHQEQTKEGMLEVRRAGIVTGIARRAADGLGSGDDQALDAGGGLIGGDLRPLVLVLEGLDGVGSDAEHAAKQGQERRQFVDNVHGYATPTGVDENLSRQF